MELVIICKNWDFLFENKISVAQILMMGVTHKHQLALAFFLADAQCFISVSVLTCESLHMCLQMTSTGEDIFALVASLGLLSKRFYFAMLIELSVRRASKQSLEGWQLATPWPVATKERKIGFILQCS